MVQFDIQYSHECDFQKVLLEVFEKRTSVNKFHRLQTNSNLNMESRMITFCSKILFERFPLPARRSCLALASKTCFPVPELPVLSCRSGTSFLFQRPFQIYHHNFETVVLLVEELMLSRALCSVRSAGS